ncbi:lipid II-degrading bacteriocin [Pectobacterium brasiliense]|uniref:lipid II-degrading bacteriocin n=1 Tax=Pectobacterium brasiliense TaxID=180957 RepID=UPI00366B9108
MAETGLELFNDLKDSLPRSGEILSGVTAPFEAFDHYLFGNGVERSININDVGFNINVSQIPPIMSLLNGKNVAAASSVQICSRQICHPNHLPE